MNVSAFHWMLTFFLETSFLHASWILPFFLETPEGIWYLPSLCQTWQQLFFSCNPVCWMLFSCKTDGTYTRARALASNVIEKQNQGCFQDAALVLRLAFMGSWLPASQNKCFHALIWKLQLFAAGWGHMQCWSFFAVLLYMDMIILKLLLEHSVGQQHPRWTEMEVFQQLP